MSDWKQINDSSRNRQHAALASDFLCQDGKVDAIRNRIHKIRPIQPGSGAVWYFALNKKRLLHDAEPFFFVRSNVSYSKTMLSR